MNINQYITKKLLELAPIILKGKNNAKSSAQILREYEIKYSKEWHYNCKGRSKKINNKHGRIRALSNFLNNVNKIEKFREKNGPHKLYYIQ